MQDFAQLRGRSITKPIFGSLGNGVQLLADEGQAATYFRRCEQQGRVIYQQEVVDHGGQDLRCLVVGQEVYAMLRNRPGHLITNISQGGIGQVHQLTAAEKQLALAASQAVGTAIAGVDLVRSKRDRSLRILEVNSSPGWQSLSRICDVDIGSRILTFIQGLAVG